MSTQGLYYQPHIQQTLQLDTAIRIHAKRRDELRKQRDDLDLRIEDAKLRRRTAYVLELTSQRDDIHAQWWETVQALDVLGIQQTAALNSTKRT